MSKPTIPFHPPFSVFVGRCADNDRPWEATLTGCGSAMYLYGKTPLEVLLKAVQAVEKYKP